MILQNENLQGAEGMKRISVRIIQSLSDYPGNMERCQVEEVVIGGCAVSVSVWTCICASSVCFFFEKQWHFCTLIEIISMRIEPSQSNSTLYDYFCAFEFKLSVSVYLSSFANNTERFFGCDVKKKSKKAFRMRQINCWLSMWHFVREDFTISIIVMFCLPLEEMFCTSERVIFR